MVPGSPSPLLYVDHVVENGTALYQAACERNLEGIVAKRANAAWTPDATAVRRLREQE